MHTDNVAVAPTPSFIDYKSFVDNAVALGARRSLELPVSCPTWRTLAELRTVSASGPRQSGKTTYIAEAAMAGDLVISYNNGHKDRLQSKLAMGVDHLTAHSVFGGHAQLPIIDVHPVVYNRIYIDDASWVYDAFGRRIVLSHLLRHVNVTKSWIIGIG